MSLFLFAIVQSLLFTTVFSEGTCKETSDVRFTFYGMPDGGDTTAFPCGDKGNKAGGTGSYSDPVTLATSKYNPAFSQCEVIYLPYFQKYFQMADHCVACDDDFKAGNPLHLDLWVGGNTNDGPNHLLCEQTFGSITDQTMIQSPPSTLPVDPGQLWDGSACHDASSANPFVHLNPDTSGLCSGGGNGDGNGSGNGDGGNGGGNGGGTEAPAPQNVAPAPQDAAPAPQNDAPQDAPITPPDQLSVAAPVKNVLPEPMVPASSASITPSVTPTTMMTMTSTSSSSTATSSNPNPAPQVADCASGVGCLGSPCETFSDCAGDWICMGVPKTCHDNRSN